MWIPGSEDELVRAVNAPGRLVETDSFDAKAELPKKSMDLATDVAAMATAGGVLCYGVAEDATGQATVLAPVRLEGARERIDQIVQAGVAEAPYIEIRQLATVADTTRGYVLVLIPASSRAPHMVTVNGDNRFYRRSGTRNVPMNEFEVATIYERRHQWTVEAASSLATEINQPLIQPTDA